MSINQYQKYREELIDFLKRDIVGPYAEDEILAEAPNSRYSSGILFPQLPDPSIDTSSRAENLDMETRNEEEIGTIEYSTSFFPSAMGISFLVGSTEIPIELEVTAAKYVSPDPSDAEFIKIATSSIGDAYFQNETFNNKFNYKDGYLSLKSLMTQSELDYFISIHPDNTQFKDTLYKIYRIQNGWKRIPIKQKLTLNLGKQHTADTIEGENLKVSLVVKENANSQKLCTVTLINTSITDKNTQNDHKLSYFQVGLMLSSPENGYVFEDLSRSQYVGSDPEDSSLKLLFREKRFYATGHGCSVEWESSKNRAKSIKSATIPSYTVPQMSFEIGLEGESKNLDLKMATLAYEDQKVITQNLNGLVDAYKSWIDGLKDRLNDLEKDLRVTAQDHIDLCEEAARRMRGGIELLANDTHALRAFKLSNEAMLMQRRHSSFQKIIKFPDEAISMPTLYDDRNTVEPSAWRPFQIAFLLMGIESLSNPKSDFKDIVDLIWFPTGGGKTEAYLGLTAYTIFIRRLTNPDSISGGTTVLMRYTLRLLTAQQFQRACTLICAAEKLRLANDDLGTSKISIGLWLGGDSTPNSIKDAEYRIQKISKQSDGTYNNPFQVLACPWCSTRMTRKSPRGVNAYLIKSKPKKHFAMYCPNKNCDFNDELPISIVDEDIYNQPPTLLFGTVDKFALLPWRQEATGIFALDEGNSNLSPELIIQDELHLISGSLGTVVGIYETALDILCSVKDPARRPKIIASTATIRRAKEQCMSLYSREMRQFPSPGLDSSDSFFAKESAVNSDKPGREYIGVMPSGATSTWLQIKLMAGMSQAADIIEADDEIKDQFWTQVIYCNSIREVGSSMSLAFDDVKAYSKTLAEKYHKKPSSYSDWQVRELTGRIPAESIPDILQKLDTPYPDKNAIRMLLATNMISVGVDINRLGLMMVVGQPKSTSEYIQATSRVGRSNPGLVVALYSPTKSRDRSHYEQFVNYHQALYRSVEPTSVTPFSAPVRDKALHAIVLILIRHYLGIRSNKDLINFNPNDSRLGAVKKEILNRIQKIDPAESPKAAKEIDDIIDTIARYATMGDGSVFGSMVPVANQGHPALMRPVNSKLEEGYYPTLTSMRNTDVVCSIRVEKSV